MRDLLIGVDVGTSALKAVLFSQDGSILGTSRQGYSINHPGPGYAQQQAEDWWTALVAAVHALTCNTDAARVCAIGLSTQGGTLQAVDAHGQALHPAISWMDTRAQEQEATFRAHIGGKQIHKITGWNLCGGLNALQILWLRQNQPSTFHDADKFLSVPSYLTLRLTGRAAVDRSNAGVEQLLDVNTGKWSPLVMELLGVDERRLADIVEAHESVGTLTPQAAQTLGLSKYVVVAAGGHDQYCAALGAGAVSGRDRLIATGTAWAILAAMDAPPQGSATIAAISRHVVPQMWGALLSLDSGGSSLEWLRNLLATSGAGQPMPLEQVNRLAGGVTAGSDGLMFYPYFSGVEYPLGLQNARAGFSGLSYQHNGAHMARAVMEGVACQAIWMLEALGTSADGELILTGGASKSDVWTGIIADIAGRSLTLPAITEAGCTGAAALAGVAAGLYASPSQGVAQLSGQRRTVHPSPDCERYRSILANFKEGALRIARA